MEREQLKTFSSSFPELTSIIELDPFLASQNEISGVTPISEGVAHYVFQINIDNRKVFLKIRGDHFSRLPEIAIKPEDIRNEYKALIVYGSAEPENFPRVFSFNNQGHYIITSDAAPDGELFQETLLKGSETPEMVYNLGKTLKKIHASTATYTVDVRGEGDGIHYDTKLLHRFGFSKNSGLEEMVERLKKQKKQLILGDPAPKNIGVNNNGSLFVFFDLEDAHQGNPVFDYGYLLGHIILHNCLSSEKALDLINGYASGYGKSSYDEETIKKIALGTIRYRLAGKIPYPCPNIPQDLRSPILHRIESVLMEDLKSIDWDILLNHISV